MLLHFIMISPLKQAIHFSGAAPGKEQPDEAGLELVPRDEVRFLDALASLDFTLVSKSVSQ